MNESEIIFRPIGVIRTPYTRQAGTPVQPAFAGGTAGTVELLEPYAEGLKDVEMFSHLILLYVFDRAGPAALTCVPYLDDTQRGVFACRAPSRPNPLGLSVVRLVARHDNVLRVQDVDMLDRTPLLDIKPYVPQFDAHPEALSGWLGLRADRSPEPTADDRFSS
jgi:tRNA-Thr(GGU) m(6)t(6)A37 methyltransferase TsaA